MHCQKKKKIIHYDEPVDAIFVWFMKFMCNKYKLNIKYDLRMT